MDDSNNKIMAGNSWQNFVYRLIPAAKPDNTFVPLGCFEDKNNRALPYKLGDFTAKDCFEAAAKAGASFVGL